MRVTLLVNLATLLLIKLIKCSHDEIINTSKLSKKLKSLNPELSQKVQDTVYLLRQQMPENGCADQLTRRQLTIFVRSALLKNCTLDGLLRLLNHDYNCTSATLMKILQYAPWPWWEKLIARVQRGRLGYREMLKVTEFPRNKKFITLYYFKFVDTYWVRCYANQLVAALRYRRNITMYWKWTDVKRYMMWLLKSICYPEGVRTAEFNSKVVLAYNESLQANPVYIVNFYRFCAPTLIRPWTVPNVLMWLQNCTQLHHPDCCKDLCHIISMANNIGCEPFPCFRNSMIIASKYKQTKKDLIRIFMELNRNKYKRTDIDKFYDAFERTLIKFMYINNRKKLERVVEPNIYAYSSEVKLTKSCEMAYDDYDLEVKPPTNNEIDQYPKLEELEKPKLKESSKLIKGLSNRTLLQLGMKKPLVPSNARFQMQTRNPYALIKGTMPQRVAYKIGPYVPYTSNMAQIIETPPLFFFPDPSDYSESSDSFKRDSNLDNKIFLEMNRRVELERWKQEVLEQKK